MKTANEDCTKFLFKNVNFLNNIINKKITLSYHDLKLFLVFLLNCWLLLLGIFSTV